MKLAIAMGYALGLCVAVAFTPTWYVRDSNMLGAASAARSKGVAAFQAPASGSPESSAITLPSKAHPGVDRERARMFSWPCSITLSPNGRWLAATSEDGVWARELKTSRWIRRYGQANPPEVRWHPTKPAFIGTDGSADQPDYFLVYLTWSKKRPTFRSDPYPFAWTSCGLVWHWGVIDLAKSDVHGVTSYNRGYPIPWIYGDKAEIRYMSSGPRDQVAAEIQPLTSAGASSPQRVETYRRVPGRPQWVRSGKIEPEVKGQTVVWYPRNPIWLGDGRLVYLRIYPSQWTHALRSPDLNAKAATARNRAELWVCNATGKGQRNVTTLWDLRLLWEYPSADWMTIDRSGRTLYYISWDKIKVVKFKKPI